MSHACSYVYKSYKIYTFTKTMRTNIVINDELMAEVLEATGIRTKREAVEMGLKALLRLKKQESIRGLRGKLDWQGDLDVMRSNR